MSHDDFLDLKAERDDWHRPSKVEGKRETNNNLSSGDSGSNGSGGIITVIITLILAVLLAGLGYWVAEQLDRVYEQFERTNQQLDLISRRVQVLESKLDVSNDSMASSAAAFKATLKNHDSEIRKLWGVSYDRNRKSIQANKNELDGLLKSLKALKKSNDQLAKASISLKTEIGQLKKLELTQQLTRINGQLTNQESALSKASSDVKTLSEKLAPMSSLVEGQQNAIQVNQRKIKELNNELVRSLTDVESQLNDKTVENRVKKLAELVDSIDKSRSRVNSELVKLSGRVNDLQKRAAQK
jgi:DNA repair exonuclease SbcCD ATPase subunit